MCKFCDEIYVWDNYNCKFIGKAPLCTDSYYDEDYKTCIATLKDGTDHYLFVPCEDHYYSGLGITINFCPKCGRKLT